MAVPSPGCEGNLLAAGNNVMALARRKGGKMSYRLREGMSAHVLHAPLIPKPCCWRQAARSRRWRAARAAR